MKLGGNKNWVKAADLKNGDCFTFTNEGEWVESTKFKYPDGSPQKQFVIGVKINGEEKDFTLNKSNRTAMIEAYGDDTAAWVGHSAVVEKVKALVSGKMIDTVLLKATENWSAAKGEAEEVPTDEVPF